MLIYRDNWFVMIRSLHIQMDIEPKLTPAAKAKKTRHWVQIMTKWHLRCASKGLKKPAVRILCRTGRQRIWRDSISASCCFLDYFVIWGLAKAACTDISDKPYHELYRKMMIVLHSPRIVILYLIGCISLARHLKTVFRVRSRRYRLRIWITWACFMEQVDYFLLLFLWPLQWGPSACICGG